MSADKQTGNDLVELLGRFLHEDVEILDGINGDGQPTIKLTDSEQEIAIEISAKIGSSMLGYTASLCIKEIDAFKPFKLTNEQSALGLERGRIGYYFWNREGGIEGPLKLSTRHDVQFTTVSDNEGYWHGDGRFAWGGDLKNHQHPRDLVARIVPPGEAPDED
jgi:hypothetical protein